MRGSLWCLDRAWIVSQKFSLVNMLVFSRFLENFSWKIINKFSLWFTIPYSISSRLYIFLSWILLFYLFISFYFIQLLQLLWTILTHSHPFPAVLDRLFSVWTSTKCYSTWKKLDLLLKLSNITFSLSKVNVILKFWN